MSAEAEWPEVLRTLALSWSAIMTTIVAVAALRISPTIAKRAEERERRAATVALIRGITSNGAMLDRFARTYAYRTRVAGETPDPYAGSPYRYEHDLICILNYLEGACIEIERGYVDRAVIEEGWSNVILGGREMVGVLDELLEGDQRENYPFLLKLAAEFDKDGVTGTKVPDLKAPADEWQW